MISDKSLLIRALQNLLQTLSLAKLEAGVLDTNIAEYVFFPLSHVFRQATIMPCEILELSLHCLEKLLPGTWCRDVDSEIHRQLLTLLTFLISGDQSLRKAHCPNERVMLAALRCSRQLLEPHVSGPCHGSVTISKTRTLFLGHVTTVVLDCVSHPSSEISSAASETLRSVVFSVQSKNILRRFTPGIVSTITKLLQPSTWLKKSSQSIVSALSVLECLLPIVLVPNCKSDPPRKAAHEMQGLRRFEDDWLSQNLPQIQNALSSILRFKKLDKDAVIESLFRFCYSMLLTCNDTLQAMTISILETLIDLSSLGSKESYRERTLRLANLLAVHPQIPPMFKDLLHRWLMAIPRLVMAHDCGASRRHMSRIATCYEIARVAAIDVSVLNTDLLIQLLDSVTAVLDMNGPDPLSLSLIEPKEAVDGNRTHVHHQKTHAILGLPICENGSRETLDTIENFVKEMSSQGFLSFLETHFVKLLGIVNGKPKLAHLWMSSKIMNSSLQLPFEIMHHQLDAKNPLRFSETLYATSLEILTRFSLEPSSDWRIQAISLQIVAMFASRQGPSFRYELLESLYPVVESLASSNPQLREYAWLCIESITQACGYKSTEELLIENIDYLINSVALKMNISAVSLEAPKVLATAIRICGDMVVPFLDDIVESVYSTLAMYHGYPQLVETLFSFLATMVSVTIDSVTAHPIKTSHQIKRGSTAKAESIIELANVLHIESQFYHKLEASCDLFTQPDIGSGDSQRVTPLHNDQISATVTADLERSTKFRTVQTVVSLGQHYLTHDSPYLRCQVLKLTGHSCTMLYTDENHFLPLVNEVWPVVVKRLYDSEASVCIAACTTVSEFFSYAGDFLESRVQHEWPDISRLYRQKTEYLEQEEKGKASRYKITYSTWNALVIMLCSLIGHMKVGGGIEDDLIEMLGPYYNSRDDVCYALDSLNRDAVWLRQHRSNVIDDASEQPQLEGYVFMGNSS